jgi:cyclic pyranopterin phosphate synthase
MPLDEYEWIQKSEILTYEEIARLARLFASLGAEKIRLTGGEPLVRKGLEELVAKLAVIEGIKDICLTTNAALLAEQATPLRQAGLRRINVSLDTLRPGRFQKIAQRGSIDSVLNGLFAAKREGFHPIKINAVIEKGVNDDEILDLVEFGREHGFPVRFIEYMDVGNTNHWQSDRLVSKKEILAIVASRFPLREVGRAEGSAPAVDYASADAGVDVGVIASVTEPFCGGCTRARLTADGKLVTCLFSREGHDLKKLLRGGASDEEILAEIRGIWQARRDRFSEERWTALNSTEGYHPEQHKKIEMIRLGG